MNSSLLLDARPGEGASVRRFLIKINRKPYWLTSKAFSYLAKLAHHHLNEPGYFLLRERFEPGTMQGRHIYRLREQIEGSGLVIESQHSCGYRLSGSAKVTWDREQIKKFPDAEVVQLFGE